MPSEMVASWKHCKFMRDENEEDKGLCLEFMDILKESQGFNLLRKQSLWGKRFYIFLVTDHRDTIKKEVPNVP